jgi:2'-5' RNA ligase
VLWAGIQGDRDRLGRLSETVAAAARRCRVRVDERPFRPHVTLARARGTHPRPDLRPYVERMAAFRTPRWLVKEMELFESVPPPAAGRPPIYASRGRWALTGR